MAHRTPPQRLRIPSFRRHVPADAVERPSIDVVKLKEVPTGVYEVRLQLEGTLEL